MSATSALYALGAVGAGGVAAPADDAARAVAGQAPVARRALAASRGGSPALVPFYEYDEARFFRSDDAPAEIAARRRAGFMRLAALYAARFAETAAAAPREVEDGISDLQFTSALPRAVPVQPLRARATCQAGAFVAVVRRASRSPISTATASTT